VREERGEGDTTKTFRLANRAMRSVALIHIIPSKSLPKPQSRQPCSGVSPFLLSRHIAASKLSSGYRSGLGSLSQNHQDQTRRFSVSVVAAVCSALGKKCSIGSFQDLGPRAQNSLFLDGLLSPPHLRGAGRTSSVALSASEGVLNLSLFLSWATTYHSGSGSIRSRHQRP